MDLQTLKYAEEWISRQVDQGEFPFATLKVYKLGQGVVSNFSKGFMDENETKANEDTILRLASNTKLITAVGVMICVERGLIQNILDPLKEYIPSFANMRVKGSNTFGEGTVKAKRDITIQDVLTTTAGLSFGIAYNQYPEFRDKEILKTMNLEKYIDMIAARPLHCHPGERWAYSSSWAVLGRLIEVVSGKSFPDFLQENIFDPLGMNDTKFYVEGAKANRLASLYTKKDRKGIVAALGTLNSDSKFDAIPQPVRPGSNGKLKLVTTRRLNSFSDKERLLRVPNGGGGLLSTTKDYLTFMTMLCDGGVSSSGKRIIGQGTIEYMMINHLPDGKDIAQMGGDNFGGITRKGQGFGLGGAVITNPAMFGVNASVNEYCWGGAYRTFSWVDRTAGVAVFFGTQVITDDIRYRRVLRNLVNSALMEKSWPSRLARL